MIEVTLTRMPERGNSTPGVLTVSGLSRKLYTCEDKWLDNEPRISCIPKGRYLCQPHGWEPNSPFKYKQVWQITNVPNRTAILIHAGNTHIDTLGCVLVGLGLNLQGSDAVISQSRIAVDMLRKHIGPNSFWLTIKGKDDD
jgi:hypothetical protein